VLGGHAGMLLSTGQQVGMLFGTAMLKWVTHSSGEWQVHCELSVTIFKFWGFNGQILALHISV